MLGLWLGNRGVTGMSLMVMVSALGAVSGLILAGCRLHASVGADYRIFAWLGRWNRAAQRAGVFARDAGSRVRAFDRRRGDRRRAEHGRSDGDNSRPAGTAVERYRRLRHARGRHFALVLVLLLLTGISLLVLRHKDREPRAFPVPLYPIVPLIFIGASGYMLYASIAYAKALSLMGLVPLVVGVPLYVIRGQERATEEG